MSFVHPVSGWVVQTLLVLLLTIQYVSYEVLDKCAYPHICFWSSVIVTISEGHLRPISIFSTSLYRPSFPLQFIID